MILAITTRGSLNLDEFPEVDLCRSNEVPVGRSSLFVDLRRALELLLMTEGEERCDRGHADQKSP